MKAIWKPILVLSLICIISSALLGATYTMTKPAIEDAERRATEEAMLAVLPQASPQTSPEANAQTSPETPKAFTEFTEGPAAQLIAQTAETKLGLLMAAKADNGAGYVFKVQDKGFGGVYILMVGIGPDGTLTGVKLMDNQETPGLGTKTGQEKFTDKFIGQPEDGVDGVEKIVGATISSNAFKRAVHVAFEAYGVVKEGN